MPRLWLFLTCASCSGPRCGPFVVFALHCVEVSRFADVACQTTHTSTCRPPNRWLACGWRWTPHCLRTVRQHPRSLASTLTVAAAQDACMLCPAPCRPTRTSAAATGSSATPTSTRPRALERRVWRSRCDPAASCCSPACSGTAPHPTRGQRTAPARVSGLPAASDAWLLLSTATCHGVPFSSISPAPVHRAAPWRAAWLFSVVRAKAWRADAEGVGLGQGWPEPDINRVCVVVKPMRGFGPAAPVLVTVRLHSVSVWLMRGGAGTAFSRNV